MSAVKSLLMKIAAGKGFGAARAETYGKAVKAGLIKFGPGAILQWKLTEAGQAVLAK